MPSEAARPVGYLRRRNYYTELVARAAAELVDVFEEWRTDTEPNGQVYSIENDDIKIQITWGEKHGNKE